MDEKFIIGLALGMVGGALIVANSVKARTLIKDGQNEITEKVKSLKNKKKNSSMPENAEPNE